MKYKVNDTVRVSFPLHGIENQIATVVSYDLQREIYNVALDGVSWLAYESNISPYKVDLAPESKESPPVQPQVLQLPKNCHIIVLDRENPAEITWATEGYRYWCALHDISEAIRTEDKHGEPDRRFTIDEIRERFYAILEDNEVNLNKVQ